MNVVVLGGSAAGPNTGAGCSGYLIMNDNTSVVLDMGPGTLPELRKHVNYRSVSAIVISHCHLDHILDLGALCYLVKYNPATMDRKIPLHVPPGGKALLDRWGPAFGHAHEREFLDSVFDIAEYDPERSLDIESINIRFAPVVHPLTGWAMRVSTGVSGDVGYTADTGPTADLAGFFHGVSLLVCEATEPDGVTDSPETRGHMTATEAGRLAMDSDAKALILTHIWEETGQDQAVQGAAVEFNGPIMIARPGLTVHV